MCATSFSRMLRKLVHETCMLVHKSMSRKLFMLLLLMLSLYHTLQLVHIFLCYLHVDILLMGCVALRLMITILMMLFERIVCHNSITLPWCESLIVEFQARTFMRSTVHALVLQIISLLPFSLSHARLFTKELCIYEMELLKILSFILIYEVLLVLIIPYKFP